MIRVSDFHPQLASALPDTYSLLKSSNLTVHGRVSGIFLHGSRGLANCHRDDSDIDLSLIVTPDSTPLTENLDLLREIFETTRRHWKANIEVDLAVVFDRKQCGLKCFEETTWKTDLCTVGGVDCFGLYKIGKGFDGLVTKAGILVERMYPVLKIWARR